MTLSENDIQECATGYELACDVAWRRARQLADGDDKKAEARFREMVKGIREGIAMELTERGCPETELLDTMLVVVKRAVHVAAVKNSAGTA